MFWTGETGQPWAQAVVVRGADLAYVGTRDGASAYVDSGTELIDLRGGMCLPGFIDSQNPRLHHIPGYTTNGAYQFLETRTGMLKAGTAADITVLASDLFRVDAHCRSDSPFKELDHPPPRLEGRMPFLLAHFQRQNRVGKASETTFVTRR
jgi:predicted amidohydrolase YtcJ